MTALRTAVVLPLLLGGVLLAFARPADVAIMSGDSWEYQALAVNQARGHGAMRLGLLEPIDTYRYDRVREPFRARLAEAGGRVHTYRTPGYPAFLAAVYTLCGVHPAAAVRVQLLLLALAASLLPLIGRQHWGRPGLAAGSVAGLAYLYHWAWSADQIMTEPLVTLAVVGLTWALGAWWRAPTPRTTLTTGVVAGLGLLTKGTLVFVPLCAALAMLPRAPRHAAGLLLATALTLAPYSLWASHHTGEPVLLSTQARTLLRQSNCAHTLRTGGWDETATTRGFYARPDIRDRHHLVQLARFWRAHWRQLPTTLVRKLDAGFAHLDSLHLALLLLPLTCCDLGRRAPELAAAALAVTTLALLRHALARHYEAALLHAPLVLATAAVLAVVLLRDRRPRRAVDAIARRLGHPPDPARLRRALAATVLLLAAVILWEQARWLLLLPATLAALRGRAWRAIPVPLGVVVAGFGALALVFYGNLRFNWPLAPVTTLLACGLAARIAPVSRARPATACVRPARRACSRPRG